MGENIPRRHVSYLRRSCCSVLKREGHRPISQRAHSRVGSNYLLEHMAEKYPWLPVYSGMLYIFEFVIAKMIVTDARLLARLESRIVRYGTTSIILTFIFI